MKSRKKAAKSSQVRRKKALKQELRQFKRQNLDGFWVTEFSGDHVYSLEAANISSGGVFLKGKLKSRSSVQADSVLRFNLGTQLQISINAKPVRDQISDNELGTGYEFLEPSTELTKQIRNFIKNS